MRILIVNPNTTSDFTERIAKIAEQHASPATTVTTVTPRSGPRSIESIYDELLSAAGTLEAVIPLLNGHDACIVACYSDHPTVYALREITGKPVLGIAEASMYMACMLGRRFSIVTTNDAWAPLLWDAVHHYGLSSRCASVRTTSMAVLALEAASRDDAYERILQVARQALAQDGAEVICLGCAGMTGLDQRLERALGVPVIDAVSAALKLAESLVSLGLHTSKRSAYACPAPKGLDNLPAVFAGPYKEKP